MYNDADLTVVTWNCHAGAQLRNGGLGWIIENLDPDIILVQEVRKFAPIRRWAKKKDWFASKPDHAGTVVLARKSRFMLLGKIDRRVSAGPLNRGMQPQRRLTAMSLRDNVTGRVIHANSLHTWAMGRGLAGANKHVRNEHVKQVRTSASWAAEQSKEDVVLIGGDLNENLVSLPAKFRRLTAHKLLAKASMCSTYKLLKQRPVATSLHGSSVLDEIFVRRSGFVSVKRRTTHTIPRRGGDHRCVRVILHLSHI